MFDVIGKKRWFFAFSLLITIPGLVFILLTPFTDLGLQFTIDYTGGNARDISINGVPSDNVPVTLDGFGIASAPGNASGRSVASDMISINNLSRIEVSYSPTPESQGSALMPASPSCGRGPRCRCARR